MVWWCSWRHAILHEKIHNWVKDAELERRAAMKQRASTCSRREVSKRPVNRKKLFIKEIKEWHGFKEKN